MKKSLLKRLAVLFVLVASLLILALQVSADDGQITSWTEYAANPDGTIILGDPGVLQPTEGGITVFADRASFDTATDTQMEDDFESSLIGANNVCSDAAPWNSMTNGACYAPGDLMDGFSGSAVVNGGGGDNVVLTNGFLGVPCNAIGPNSFADDWDLAIDDPAIYGVAFEVIAPLDPVNINIDVYGAGGMIGSTSTSAGATPVFFGVVANEPITQISTADPSGNGELFCNLVLARRAPTDVSLTDFGASNSSNLLPIFAVSLIAIIGLGVYAFRRNEA